VLLEELVAVVGSSVGLAQPHHAAAMQVRVSEKKTG
jgi:hypothetical protein